ncbi:MAG: ABC transporter permease subunit [Clostridia bacterium]|nr:ABC transporter permease subunit [Clostridia bacterium]
MLAIYKRELSAYFTSTIGYIFMAVFLALSGAIVWFSTFFSASTSFANYFFIMIFFFIVLIPILTMKLLSEERRTKTEQILLTSPVSLAGIVTAKFFAALTLFEVTFLISLLNLIPVSRYGTVNIAEIISNFIGVTCVAASLIAIGIFISALTESQFIAAIGSIAVILGTLLVGLFSSSISNNVIRIVVKWFSILDRYVNFRYGIFDVSSIIYYVSISAIFLFLTVRVYEKRRWA